MTKRTWAFVAIAGSLLVPMVLGAILFFAFPAERVGAIAAERASAALDRDVSVDRIRLKFFPAPAVALEGVSIARWRHSQTAATDESVRASATRPLAEIQRVELRPRLLPLFRREVAVHAIIIDRPALVVELDGETEPLPESVREGGTGFWDEATFAIERIQVREGTLEYHDLTTGGTARVVGINQEVRIDGELRDGELSRLTLAGELSAAEIDADMPEHLAVPLTGVRLSITHDAVLDLTNEQAVFNRLALTLQEMTLEGSGSMESWSDPAARAVSFRLSTGDTELTPLLASLPASMRSWPANATAGDEWSATAGRARLEAAVVGRFGDGEVPAVDGTLSLQDVALARGSDPVVTDLAGEVIFSLDSASTDGLTAQVLGAPLQLTFNLRDPSAPVVQAMLETRIDLARATALGLLPADWSGSGAPHIDLAMAGPVKDPAAIAINGQVSLAGVALETPELPAPISLRAGALEFGGTELVGRGLEVAVGESDIALDFAAADWLPFAFGDREGAAPHLLFDSRSRLLDLDALFPVDPAEPTYGQLFFARLANTPIDGRSATDAAEAAGLKLPEVPSLVMEGRLRAERIIQRGSEMRDVDLQLAARDRQLELRSADLQMLEGGVHLSARLGSAEGEDGSPRKAPLMVDFRVADVGAEPFLQRFTAFRDHLSGSLGLEGTLSMELDQNLLPEPATLAGGGSISVAGGQLVNWSMVKALGDQLGIAQFDTLTFQDWNGRFDMVGSRIVLGETLMQAGDLSIRTSGSFDVSGALDLAGTVYLSPALTARVGGTVASRLAAAAGGEDGRVPVGVRVSGTVQQPSVGLDLSEAGSRLAERAREEAEAEARELARGLADRFVTSERIPQVESPAAALDSARQRVGDAVRGGLRGLLSPRGAAAVGDPPQPDRLSVDQALPPADTAGFPGDSTEASADSVGAATPDDEGGEGAPEEARVSPSDEG